MARYDRSYDYGLRGYRETTFFRGGQGARPRAWGYDRDFAYPRTAGGGFSNRVTARYNRDYAYDRPYRGFERNYNPYGGDRIGRIGDMQDYLHGYHTIGGTHTSRGGFQPPHEVPRDPLQDNMASGYDWDLRRGRW
ncbi:MAG TPA: hypothetical protein VHG28_24780 [Longimicrobiaceae bacterium]|nr:hypothetical protein [Longimicrobiaceae bacterium]